MVSMVSRGTKEYKAKASVTREPRLEIVVGSQHDGKQDYRLTRVASLSGTNFEEWREEDVKIAS